MTKLPVPIVGAKQDLLDIVVQMDIFLSKVGARGR